MHLITGPQKGPRTSPPPRGCVLLILLLWQLPVAWTQSFGAVSFSTGRVVVQEDVAGQINTVSVPLVREGGLSGAVAVSMQVTDPNNDFFSNEVVAFFSDGSSTAMAVLVVVNDVIPENNETFIWRLVDTGQAELGSSPTIEVIILASDQPHGLLQFTMSSLAVVTMEPATGTGQEVTLSVARTFGTFGRVTVDFQVQTSGLEDVTPLMGGLTFEEGVATQNLTLSVLPDDIPEMDEAFTVHLVNPRGGATLAASNIVATVTVAANDAPVRWAESLTSVEEDVGVVTLNLTRGLTMEGATIGDLSQETTVAVATHSGSASAGSDFTPLDTTVTFAAMATTASVSISITDDSDAEGDEMFSVLLSSVSSDAVLATPTSIVVLVLINDDAGGVVSFTSPGPVVVQEDDAISRTATFTIQRLVGSHGNLSIEWQVLTSANSLATRDFTQAQGTVAMAAGVTMATLVLEPVDDSIAEEAESFVVELVRVISGVGTLSDTGHRLASLIVADSDNVYGLLEWGPENLVMGTAPRELTLSVARSTSTVGVVAVDYTISYSPAPTSSSPNPTPLLVTSGVVRLQSGQSLLTFSVALSDSLFLETQGRLLAVISNVTLVGGATPLIVPTNSPQLGLRMDVVIAIPVSATSGLISLDSSSLQLNVNESQSGLTFVTLTLVRTGSFGTATVTWAVQPQTALLMDVGQSSGIVVIPNGVDTASFQIPIVADDVPEVDELLLVTLLTVAERNQRISPSQNTSVVTILANDSPGGVFSISTSTSGPFFLNEDSSDSVIISIIRSRGDLTRELVRFDLTGRAGQIAGGRGLADFPVHVRVVNVTLLVINDLVPEVNESFVFAISNLDSGLELAPPTSVSLTVLGNDDFAGVFSFNRTEFIIVEPQSGGVAGPVSMTILEVVRTGGAFGTVMLEWGVVNPTSDLTPTTGLLQFHENDRSATFLITATPDDITEGVESYNIRLVVVSGEGRVGSAAMATVTIQQNDDPISFEGSVIQEEEGGTAEFIVSRSGPARDLADVRFEVRYDGGASTADVSVLPPGGILQLPPGASRGAIMVQVLEDELPEAQELLTLVLVASTGDTVLGTPTSATLIVPPNDDPNGRFSFSPDALDVMVTEGQTVNLPVVRDAGTIGSVTLQWTLYSVVGGVRTIADNQDIVPAAGILTFDPGVATLPITLTMVDETVAELAELFEVEVDLSDIQTTPLIGAALGNDTVAMVTIAASDDPHGVLDVSISSSMLSVAEDLPPQSPGLGTATVEVERSAGTIGSVRALWEVWPEGAGSLPQYVDLLFYGEAGPAVSSAMPRLHSNTSALSFTGQSGSTVSVPAMYQPTNLSSGYSISCWLRPSPSANGELVSWSAASGLLFSLSLVSDDTNFLLVFRYTQTTGTTAMVDVPVAKALLIDSSYHSLVAVVSTDRLVLYRDGTLVDSRILMSYDITSDSGTLLVGGMSGGNFYTGELQDVRIYLAPMTSSQVRLLTSDVSSRSLVPISGYLYYPPGSSQDSFSLSSVDDDIPEPPEVLVVSLTNIAGGARLGGRRSASITVLKSDSSNGEFGISSDPPATSLDETTGSLVVAVNRSRGTFGNVTVTWEIREAATLVVARDDFIQATGAVVFLDGVTEERFLVRPLDEMVAELTENFLVVLTLAVVNDDMISSTPSSSANIISDQSSLPFSVAENDFPYGVLQLSPSSSQPLPPFTLAMATPKREVMEEVGVVRVYVERAQGVVGEVTVEYFTTDGSASSIGLMPDYVSSAGTLTFAAGQTVASFDLTLLDNDRPELAKTFSVNLTNPQATGPGVPSLLVAQSLLVVVQPSDDAFGRFFFSPNSLAFLASEQTGGFPLTLTVIREGGSFGEVGVAWEVVQADSQMVTSDVRPSTGSLIFQPNSTSSNFTLDVFNDLEPELLEVFLVRLVNVSVVGASVTTPSSATISIEASDHPYGLFVFTPSYRPFRTSTELGRVELVVTREFGSLGRVQVDVSVVTSSEVEANSVLIGQPFVQDIIRNRQLATSGEDFSMANFSLVFETGDLTRSVYVNITEDNVPEVDEYFFVVLTRVDLDQSSLSAVDSSVLPMLPSGNASVGVVIISENDNARGVVQFAQASYEASEPAVDFLLLERSRGLFGNISVSWRALSGSANSSDFSPTSGTLTIIEGVASVPLPLAVTDDTEPEFSEMFTVQLVGVSGGGSLGDRIQAQVTIQDSDDPNGAFEFDVDSRSFLVSEPDDEPTPVTLRVLRSGGTVGVVSVSWRVTQNGASASGDVLPVSGSLPFFTLSSTGQFIVSILPDNIPEVEEVYMVELVNATGGANIGSFPMATITVPANDGPHGVVQFSSPVVVTLEVGDDGNSTTSLMVTRSVGFFGAVRVFYTVQSADPASLALAGGVSVFSYFATPISDTSLFSSLLLRGLEATPTECARACLADRACLSFTIHESSSTCSLFLATVTNSNSQSTVGVVYYEKLQAEVLEFYQSVASAGSDFVPVVGQSSVVIPDGASNVPLPVVILGDNVPELNESLTIRLTNVELATPTESQASPILGSIVESTIVIEENDNPRGVFVLQTSEGRSEVRVQEPDEMTVGVTLVVMRERGSIGRVSVEWMVTGGDATEMSDFVGGGATLVFDEGDMMKTVVLSVSADALPELDETIVVSLTAPTNGAVLSPDRSSVTIVILANDEVAGMVGFSPQSRSAVVGEGQRAEFTVERVLSALGRVEVNWTISGNSDPSLEFTAIAGTAVFMEGENQTVISLLVRSDATPELEERFILTLDSVSTFSSVISSSAGAASLDPQARTADISIRASNNPHGQVDFQTSSLSVTVGEGLSQQLTVIRQFGSFGTLEVTYMAENVSGSGLAEGVEPATPGEDFESVLRSIRIAGSSAIITVSTLQDSEAEIAEIFAVRLLSVTLVGASNDTIPPTLGPNHVANVTITSNDSPEGILTFTQDSYTVEEGVAWVNVTIVREQGRVGVVSAIYFSTNGLALNGDDYIIDPVNEVIFSNGQSEVTLAVAIVDDNTPEEDETFCLGIRLPRFGASIGNISETCVTIVANDDTYGVFSFTSDSLRHTLQETVDTPTSNNVAVLRVMRERGLFGSVTVPYEVVGVAPAGALVSDLSSHRGALTFQQGENLQEFTLEAVMDSDPELAENFTVSLRMPTGTASLAVSDTVATIEVLANQEPQGVLSLVPLSLPQLGGSLQIEEAGGRVNLQVIRTQGSFGTISVTMATEPGSATFSAGNELVGTITQEVGVVSGRVWHHVTSTGGQDLLVVGTNSSVIVYGWRGVAIPLQTLQAVGVAAITSFSPTSMQDVIVVANGGVAGQREVMSHVYVLNDSDQLSQIQSIATVGASDVVALTIGGSWYVAVASGEDNSGNPNVDSDVYLWNGTALVRTQSLATIGASALEHFSVDGALYLAVSSLTDTRSQVFVWREGRFRLDHVIPSARATDVIFLRESEVLVLTSDVMGVSILVRSVGGVFTLNSTLSTQPALKVEAVGVSPGGVVITYVTSPAQLYNVTTSAIGTVATPISTVVLPISSCVYSFSLSSMDYLAVMELGTVSIYELVAIDPTSSDFYSRDLLLTFEPGETVLNLTVMVFDDVVPEVNENFSIALINPVGGAVLGPQSSVGVVILTNDDAHGEIGFSDATLSVVLAEGQEDSTVRLQVERLEGTFGQVVVGWSLSGEHQLGEVTPASGQVTFPPGVAMDTISLVIRAEMVPELNEVTMVTLGDILETGVSPGGDVSRGTRLRLDHMVATVTVQANDEPHGVVRWSVDHVTTEELDGRQNIVALSVLREFGTVGALVVEYSTQPATSAPLTSQATELMDYVPSTGEVVIGNNVTIATIFITILPDNTPEANESFLVNLTSVRLADEADRGGSVSSSPFILPPGQVLEVVISENDNNRGLLGFSRSSVTVEETLGASVTLQVLRDRGAFGVVGVDYQVTVGMATTEDFTGPVSGTFTFDSGQTSTNLTFFIVDDVIPEEAETFQVTLVNPTGGVQIGDDDNVLITIPSNDDISGIFAFAPDTLLILVSESSANSSGTVTFTVNRAVGSVGTNMLYWEVELAGRMDLDPIAGNLTFLEGETTLSFNVTAVGDGLPELQESFVVRLVALEGAGRIVDPREARVAIQSSDDPAGILGLELVTGGVTIDEGDTVTLGVVRGAGSQDTVTLTWSISPPEVDVFTSVTDTIVLLSGQTEATISIQTLSDNVPEVQRSYLLRLVSSTVARINDSSDQIEITVRASDNPHGTVDFASTAATTTEDVGVVTLNIVRLQGLVGDLRVNISTVAMTAEDSDFTFTNSSVVIPTETSSVEVVIGIIDDTLPELDEVFAVRLTSVELLGMAEPGSVPPTLGSNLEVPITILASDGPFGTFRLTQDLFTVAEGSTLVITIVRDGGRLGDITVNYAFTNGRGTSDDYSAEGTDLVMVEGQATAEVVVSILDDDTPETVEDFTFTLLGVTRGQLGNITMATILIEASDSPFGVVGFSSASSVGVVIDNPVNVPVAVSLTVERREPRTVATAVTWEVTRADGGMASDDIAAASLSGTLTLASGQESGVLRISVLPSTGDEAEERFLVTIRSTTNGVAIDSSLSSAPITVRQAGMPFGVVNFQGDVLQPQAVVEQATPTTLLLPLERSGLLTLTVSVDFTVSRVGVADVGVEEDVTPASGTVMFPPLVGQTTLDLTILSDSVGEMNETFVVILTNPTGGASLNPQASSSSFTILENGSPLGQYGVVNGSVRASGNAGDVTRSLSYYVQKRGGMGVAALVVVQHSYQGSVGEVVEPQRTLTLSSSDSSQLVTVPIFPAAYLLPGSAITVTIISATVISPTNLAGLSSDISLETGSTDVEVSEEAANVGIGFTRDSLVASVDDAVSTGNVRLTVFRRGSLGEATVTWSTGVPSGSRLPAGSLLPSSGSLSFTNSNSSITLTATAASPHGPTEVFSVTLSVVSMGSTFSVRLLPGLQTALIEPQGVFQLATSSFSAVEGTNAMLTVWRRYGSMGHVTLEGVASTVATSSLPPNTEAATPTSDFPTAVLSLTMEEGVNSASFVLPLPDNAVAGGLKVFQFTLLSVVGAANGTTSTPGDSSPRLSSTNTSAMVLILDDEGGSGVFQLRPLTINTTEGALLAVEVIRSGGTSGRVAVQIQTMEMGGATSGLDFQPVDEQVVFGNGESRQSLAISIYQDSEPEFAESFILTLTQPAGQAGLVDPSAAISTVTIEASDFPAGVVSFLIPSLNLSEDGQSSGELVVTRTGGLMGVASVRWVAVVPPSVLTMSEGVINFLDGDTLPDTNIVLQLQPDSVPASGLQFQVTLTSVTLSPLELGFSQSSATVQVSARTRSQFLVVNSSLTKVVSSASDRVTLVIRRSRGVQTTSQVAVTTFSLISAATVGRLTFQPAVPTVNFAPTSELFTFAPGQTELEVSVEAVIATSPSPLAFQVGVVSPDNEVVNSSVVVVLSPTDNPLTTLYPVYFSAVAVATTQDLERSAQSLLSVLEGGAVSGENEAQVGVVQLTVDELIKKVVSPTNISFSGSAYLTTMMDVFNRVNLDPTFQGRSLLARSMSTLAYGILEDRPCSSGPVILIRNSFYLLADKVPPASLAGRRFNASRDGDFLQLPRTMVLNTQASCVSIHYIEFLNGSLYLQPTFMAKVLSVGVQNVSLSRTSEPLVYRISSNQDIGFLPEDRHCLLWQPPSVSGSGAVVGNDWDNSMCRARTHFVLRQTFVECSCSQLGAVGVASDLPRGYSWTLPAGLSAAVCILALIFSILLHLVYRSGTLLASRLFICVSFASLLFQLVLLVDIFASRSDRFRLGGDGCSAIAALLQFTSVAQFFFVAIMVFAMWASFIGLTSGREPLVIYLIVGWGAAILVVVGTILIGRFAVGLDLTSDSGLYGPINGLCFMPSLTASLLSTALPILLSVLVMAALLSHAGVYWSRWEDVRSLYLDSFNRTDVPLLIGFMAFLFLSSLSAYLHVYIGLVYTFGIFVAFNTLLCVYIAVVYFCMSWRTLRKHKKYNIKDEVEALEADDYDVPVNEDPYMRGMSISMSTLASSKENLIQDKENESLHFAGDDVVPLGVRPLPPSSSNSLKKPLPSNRSDGSGDGHFDDLMFMLKTQNFSDSFVSDESDQSGPASYERRPKAGAERYERRRISIADTHL